MPSKRALMVEWGRVFDLANQGASPRCPTTSSRSVSTVSRLARMNGPGVRGMIGPGG